MDGQGYEVIRGELQERGVDASFSPHLFEGDQTRAFHIQTSSEEGAAEEVLSALESSAPEVRLSKSGLSKDGRTANYSFVDESVPPKKAPDGDEYTFEIDDHDYEGDGTPPLSVDVGIPGKTLEGTGLRGAQYTLDIYPDNEEDVEAHPEVKHAVYAAYQDTVISIEGSVRKATKGHGGMGLHPNRVPSGTSAYEFFSNGDGNPPSADPESVPVEVWEKLEEVYAAAHEVAVDRLQAFNDINTGQAS